MKKEERERERGREGRKGREKERDGERWRKCFINRDSQRMQSIYM